MIPFGFMFYSTANATCGYAQAALVLAVDDESKRSSILIGPQPRTDVPVLMRTAADYAEAIARVLPVNEEADSLVAPLFPEPARRGRITRR